MDFGVQSGFNIRSKSILMVNQILTNKKDQMDNRILLVDDEEFCLTAMKNMLENLDVDIEGRVEECITGLEAVDHIKNSFSEGITYSLILTDFNMPEMDGLEATLNIRQFLSSQG